MLVLDSKIQMRTGILKLLLMVYSAQFLFSLNMISLLNAVKFSQYFPPLLKVTCTPGKPFTGISRGNSSPDWEWLRQKQFNRSFAKRHTCVESRERYQRTRCPTTCSWSVLIHPVLNGPCFYRMNSSLVQTECECPPPVTQPPLLSR